MKNKITLKVNIRPARKTVLPDRYIVEIQMNNLHVFTNDCNGVGFALPDAQAMAFDIHDAIKRD